MTEIIEFPGGKERLQRHYNKLIDETLNISDLKVKECIKARVSETLSRHLGIPSFKVSMSISLTESDEKILVEALTTTYNKIVSEYTMKLIGEICLLEARLCKCEYGK